MHMNDRLEFGNVTATSHYMCFMFWAANTGSGVEHFWQVKSPDGRRTEIKAQLHLYKTVASSRLCWLIKHIYLAPFGTDKHRFVHSTGNVFLSLLLYIISRSVLVQGHTAPLWHDIFRSCPVHICVLQFFLQEHFHLIHLIAKNTFSYMFFFLFYNRIWIETPHVQMR